MSNPINANLKTEALPIALLALSGLASLYFYRHFPGQVPIHWNLAGQVDGWSGPGFAAFFLPALIAGLYLLFLALPRLDPQRERYAEFSKAYHVFKNSFVGLMAALYFLTGLSGLGYDLPIAAIVPSLIGLLFILIGNYMAKLKLNWFIGARTPWTLSSETVWNKTNRLAGKLFVLGGLLMVAEAVAPLKLRLPLLLIIVTSISLVPIIYSYLLYRQEQTQKKGGR